jgi:hypothetical protein
LQNVELISSTSYGLFPEVWIYATALGRSTADIEIIQERIRSALGPERVISQHIQPLDDCKRLFRAYGELWAS